MEIERGEIVTLENGREYVCFGRAVAENQKTYLYLMTTTEPIEVCFGEEIITEVGVQVRVLGNKDEKQIALEAFKKNLAV